MPKLNDRSVSDFSLGIRNGRSSEPLFSRRVSRERDITSQLQPQRLPVGASFMVAPLWHQNANHWRAVTRLDAGVPVTKACWGFPRPAMEMPTPPKRLYSAWRRCPLDTVRLHIGVFFGSLLGTLNHLLLTDRLWLKRLTGEARSPKPSRCHQNHRPLIFSFLSGAARHQILKNLLRGPTSDLSSRQNQWPKLSKVQSVDQRMRLECGVGFRQRDVPSHTSGAAMCHTSGYAPSAQLRVDVP